MALTQEQTPQTFLAEQAVIGCLLRDSSLVPKILAAVDEADFATDPCRRAYQAARALAAHQSLTSWEWALLGIGCGLLILGQGLTFFVPDATKAALDTACYGLLAVVTVWWAVKVIIALRKSADGVSLLCLVFAWLAWVIAAKYMSAGGWYAVFMVCETLCLPLLYIAMRKAVTA